MFTLTCVDSEESRDVTVRCNITLFIQGWSPPAVCQLLDDSVPGAGQHMSVFPGLLSYGPVSTGGACYSLTK